MRLLSVSVFSLLLSLCNAGTFLLWLPLSSRSVKIGVMEVGEELARRGHKVTVVSPHKYKEVPPGVTDVVVPSDFDQYTAELTVEILTNPNVPPPVIEMLKVSLDSNKGAILSSEVQELLRSQEFDVMITLPLLGNEASYYLAHRKNSSLALFITAPFGFPYLNWAMGNPYNPAYMPSPITGFSQDMTFLQRTANTLVNTASILFRSFYSNPKVTALLEECFPGDDIPPVDDLLNSAGLFINHGTPFLGDGLRPVMPNTILAGLMSCHSNPKPLPADLATFVESAEHGVIYVSFGSVIKASKMPEDKRKMMLNVFSRLKQKVIWKWETEMPDAPSNVKISSWLPQTSLLAHRNVKVFVTHGGAGSTQETICHKTPVVGVPLFGDQIVNVNEVVNKNVGVKVDWHGMTEEIFSEAVEEVLTNPLYQNSVDLLSELIMDQPLHPLDNAVWWLEYLLRHPHNTQMKPYTNNLNWAQYFLLDVIFVVGSVILAFLYVLVRLVKCCCCGLRKPSDKSKKKK